MGLKEEIIEKRREMIVDSYPMSIGEIVNLYKDGELNVHPEFQRFFRWDEEQKTKLIESILLGIPIPPIFVSQKLNGIWDVIDGQQRLSTILQFMQVLKDDRGVDAEPLVLMGTKFLPSLKNVIWNNENLFSSEQKINFKREKLNFTIIKETSEQDLSKYEMFQRLNTGGTHLSAQEIRNCLMLMINKSVYELINELHDNEFFKTCRPITDKQLEEQYDLELIVRFLLYVFFPNDFLINIDKSRSMDLLLTEELEKYAVNIGNTEIQNIKGKFNRIFTLLSEVLGEDVFKKYSKDEDKFKGAVLIAAFEAIIPGVFLYLEYWELHKSALKSKIKDLYNEEAFNTAVVRGTRPVDRMAQLIMFSRDWFRNEN